MKTALDRRREKILESLDGIGPAEVPPYFYTRLLGRMQHAHEKQSEPVLFLRPAFLTAMLSIALVINIVFLFQKEGSQSLPTQTNKAATIETFADAYNLGTSSVYE